jgi:RNA polymerase sigma factor (sigma-70 family)
MKTSNDESKTSIPSAIQRVLNGDVNAYDIIYEDCDRPLRSFIGSRYGYLGGDFIAEVAIRTHEYALNHLKDYNADKGASFQTWLNWQSRDVARKVMAERCNPNAVSLSEELNVVYVVTPSDPAEEHERQRRNRVLRQELKSLAEQGRLSIAAHDLGRWTFSATARRLGMTVSQTRYCRKRALLELKKRVERRGIRPTEVVPYFGRVGSLPGDENDEAAARPISRKEGEEV